MYPQGPTRSSLKGALALALAAAVLAAPTFARAEDDNVPIDTKIVRSIMEGLGFKRPGEAEIKYQERAPLVIPPNTELPPPQKPGAAIANNPAWPKDPDVARAKLIRAQEANRDVNAEVEREQNPLPPDQLAPGAATVSQRTAARRTRASTDPTTNPVDTDHYRVAPSELGYHGGLFSWSNMFGGKDEEASAKFTGEPRRTTLTDPPPGYQTPSPDQPYGLGKTATAPKAVNSYATHGEMSSDSR
jgi:hypothetical protein